MNQHDKLDVLIAHANYQSKILSLVAQAGLLGTYWQLAEAHKKELDAQLRLIYEGVGR